MTNNIATARALVAEALGVNEAQLADTPRIGETPGWDSLAHMRLVLALEQHIGRQLDADEMLSIESVAEIANLL